MRAERAAADAVIELAEVDGRNVAWVDGPDVRLARHARGYGSAVPELARAMLAEGWAPSTVVTCQRGGREAFGPATVEQWAGLRVIEGESQSARFAVYRPFDAGEVA